MIKNKKGQISAGVILVIFVGVVCALALIPAIATQVEQTTRANSGTVTVTNSTITTPANGAVISLTGQELVGTPIVTNSSEGTVIAAGNYTIAECIRASDGLKGICYTTKSTYGAARSYNISYAYYPDGYADDGASRSIMGLILIFAMIAIAIFVLYPIMKERGVFDFA